MRFNAQRRVVLLQGDARIDVVRDTQVDHLVVEGKPGFVWLCFLAGRKDPALSNRKTEGREANFGEQFNIFLVVMIKICPAVVGIVIIRQNSQRRVLWHRKVIGEDPVMPSGFCHVTLRGSVAEPFVVTSTAVSPLPPSSKPPSY